MRSDSDRLLIAAMHFDRGAMRRSGEAASRSFLRVMDLRPLSDEQSAALDQDDHPLAIAAGGLAKEVAGDVDGARLAYAALLDLPGYASLLGAQLFAWTEAATPEDFSRVESALEELQLRRGDLVARTYAKLTTWALDLGWRDAAERYLTMAQTNARGDLRVALNVVAQWFGRPYEFGGPGVHNDLVLYPWIQANAERAAEKAVVDLVQERIRSPWTRTWRWGGFVGSEVQTADLQASWAGALWLLPQIRQQHAALLLRTAPTGPALTQAIGLWVVGRGANAEELIDACEGQLGEDSAAELLLRQLRGGGRVLDERVWLSACLALWDQLPSGLAHDLSMTLAIAPSVAEVSPSDALALSSRLFGLLLLTSPAAWRKRAMQLDEAQMGVVLRLVSPAVASRFPSAAARRALRGFLASSGADSNAALWGTAGWTSAARLLQGIDDSSLTTAFQGRLPTQAIAEVAAVSPSLIPADAVQAEMTRLAQVLEEDLTAARSGTFRGWGRDPRTTLARLMLAARKRDDVGVAALVRTAQDAAASRDQRLAALYAVRGLQEAGLITDAEARRASRHVDGRSVVFEDKAGDVRLEALARSVIKASTDPTKESRVPLVAGSRDADSRVRSLALQAVLDLPQRAIDTALQAVLFGALYDPEPNVQVLGVRAVGDRRLRDPSLAQAAAGRLEEMWDSAHRDVRVAIAEASKALTDRGPSATARRLQIRARKDRSWLVRDAAGRASSTS